MKRSIISLVLALACLSITLNAQLRGFNSEAFTSTSDMTCSIEDSVYLYLGTQGGLIQVNKSTFETQLFHIANSALSSNHIKALALDLDHTLWVGTSAGISSFDGSFWQSYYNDVTFTDLYSICVDTNGNVFVSGDLGNNYYCPSVVKYDGSSWSIYNSTNSDLPYVPVIDLAAGPNGEMWMLSFNYYEWYGPGGTSGYQLDMYLSSLIDGTLSVKDLQGNEPGLPGFGHIQHLEIDSEGTVWLLSKHYPSAVYKFCEGLWTSYLCPDLVEPDFYAHSMLIDDDDNLWLNTSTKLACLPPDLSSPTIYDLSGNSYYATKIHSIYDSRLILGSSDYVSGYHANRGYLSFDGTQFSEHSTAQNPIENVSDFNAYAVDTWGNLWIAPSSSQGLFKWDGSSWTQYTTANSSLTNNNVNSIYADTNGMIWIGTLGHLTRIVGNTWTVYDCEGYGLWNPKQIVRSSNNRLYVMDNSSIFCWNIIDETGQVYLSTDNGLLPSSLTRDLIMGSDNYLWVATGSGLVRARGNNVSFFNTSNTAFSSSDFRALCRDGADIWVATYDGELARITDQFEMHDLSGFADHPQQLMDMAIDNEHRIWITTRYGPLYQYADGVLSTADTAGSALKSSTYCRVLSVADGTKWIYVYPKCIMSFSGEIVENDDPAASPIPQAKLNNYPNPFSEGTTLSFYSETKEPLTLKIYNIKGQEVFSISITATATDETSWYWNGLNLHGKRVATGIYLARIEGRNFRAQRRMIMIK